MTPLSVDNAADYLRRTGRLAHDACVEVQWLAGGVSNAVFRVRPVQPAGTDFILKQACERLRVAEPWFCSIERIWRETAVLRVCHDVVGPQAVAHGFHLSVPELLWEDRDEYVYAMPAAAADAPTWKERLLAGDANPAAGAAIGGLLGRLHAETWRNEDLAREFGERSFFEALRLDPYYRHTAQMRPDLAPAFDALLQETAASARCLVHGDFSPKNLLVTADAITLLDFEVGHFGDPGFDLGFFFAHLALKEHLAQTPALHAVRKEAWEAYYHALSQRLPDDELQSLRLRATQHLGACLAARVDGKSKVDYLTPDLAAWARATGAELLTTPQDAAAVWLPHV